MSGSVFEPHLLRAERLLVKALTLRSRDIPPRLASARGLWKDAPVSITTRLYEGDAVEHLRIATVSGVQLWIGNLLLHARPNRSLPILDAQLAWRGAGRDATVDTDLFPVIGDEDDQTGSIAAALPDISALRTSLHTPALPGEWISGHALRAVIGPEPADAALAAFDAYIDAWITMAGSGMPTADRSDAVRRTQHAHADAQRGNPETLHLLGTMFGHAWAEEYLATVMFPQA